MICPKCGNGKIVSVVLKIDRKKAKLCDFCETLWFEGEVVKENTGRYLQGIKNGTGIEYILDELEENEDDENQEVGSENYTKYM